MAVNFPVQFGCTRRKIQFAFFKDQYFWISDDEYFSLRGQSFTWEELIEYYSLIRDYGHNIENILPINMNVILFS